ncbi:hypothetical protein PHLCEN_2v1606 [Hermanssonia centrifuga]|uniref:Uncharacterized protein n=1 Tax=Hermanssonia centrifuga TaxID=98765 RepID=A0A2R6RZJ3_9APHY|nr:hypothetical protein PHLCEN_2v1606 [Hermanssonia centrifuga]
MDLPTSREIELETLLRQRDAQVADLTDEVTHLRQYLTNQPSPSVTDQISLPPPLVSLLLPHINDRSSTATTSSNTVTAALTQRVKVLQEENDELYELLKSGETGRLKEDVRSLRRVVQKLEGALRESHQVIANLSTSSNGSAKPLPTAPRAHKKPRLSETQSTPSSVPLHVKENRSQSSSTRRNDSRERSPRASIDRKVPRVKMETDEGQRARPRSPERDREKEKGRNGDREKERERPKERDRDKDRDRDRDRTKRNGAYGNSSGSGSGQAGGGGSRRGRRISNANSYGSGDRTLAERMGL